MQVRDHTLPKTEYKGRPTEASDEMCPCRPCYNAHDCSDPVRVYDKQGRWVKNKTVPKMECATRWNKGCPSPKPDPEHIFPTMRAGQCKRCRVATGKAQTLTA